MFHYRFILKNKLIVLNMASLVNSLVDRAVDSTANSINPAAVIPPSMISFVDNEKINLQQIASNFLARHFEFRTKDHEKTLNVVQLMSEYVGNFSTPICYLQFYLKRAGRFIQFAEELGPLSGSEEVHRLNCIRIYKNFIQHYSELIGAVQTHESACGGRLFRRSVERMQPEIAHVPMNLHLQQLLVSSGDDPSQRSIYNTVTLGAPAVHHSRFTHGGLARIKANERETNERLCYLQEKLQDVLILNSDIDDALDHLTKIIESPSTHIEHSVLKLSLQRVIQAVVSLLEYSSKDLDKIASSSSRIVVNPLVSKVSAEEVSASQDTIHDKAKKLLEEIKESMKKDEQTFGMTQLNYLKSIADELERHTCKHIMRYIFKESMEIERYSQVYRERFDIAFSQALTCLIFSITVLLSSVKISDQAWQLYINNGEYIGMREKCK
ncbi:unnamed protein product [Rotaria sordida]|uniref:Uncharacterized protein n=2 Tax=Rotaria sordida TaxID=392033 RepID=A0A813MP48_9BILA|nr:unnamed protein product [Rotaria sordida]CAF0745180.1 unnamed protein product [Rotaria sordida]CAF0746660.1 unnamed protein product [Rotaria sordida]CAF0780659.1 unnamed protein product [Rotaria sordida]